MQDPINRAELPDRDVQQSFWDFSAVMGSRIASILMGLVATTLASRILKAEEYGRLSLFLLVAQLFFLFGINWTSAAVIKFGKEEMVTDGCVNRTVWARNTLLLPSLGLSILIICFFQGPIQDYFELPSAAIGLLILYLIGLTAADYGQALLQATANLQFYSFVKVLQMLALLSGLGVILVFPGNGPVIVSVIWAYVISVLVVSALPLLRIRPRLIMPTVPGRDRIKRIFWFSYPIIFGSVSTYVVNWVDLIVIKQYARLDDIGVYSLAYQGMTAVQQMGMVASVVATPLLVSFLVRGRADLVVRYVQRLIPQWVVLWCMAVGLIAFSGFYLIPVVFGPEFAGSAKPFALLMIAMGWNMTSTLYSAVMTAHELIKQSMAIGCVIAVVNVAGDYLLVPTCGTSGAAAATAFSFLIGASLSHWVVFRRLGLKGVKEVLLPFLMLPAVGLMVAFPPLGIRLTVLAMMLACFWLVAVTLRLYRTDDLVLLEKVAMPATMRRLFVTLYRLF